MSDIEQRFFKLESENVTQENLPHNVTIGMKADGHTYLTITNIDFYPENDNDDDMDMEEERNFSQINNASKKEMKEVCQQLLDLGFVEIDYSEYKTKSNEVAKREKENILSHLPPIHKEVHQKLKTFIEDYDITNPGQKMFIATLRSLIIDGHDVSEKGLQAHAQKMEKNLYKVFDKKDGDMIGTVSDFALKTQMELSEDNIAVEVDAVEISAKKSRGRPRKTSI